jgi:hypothetical protein
MMFLCSSVPSHCQGWRLTLTLVKEFDAKDDPHYGDSSRRVDQPPSVRVAAHRHTPLQVVCFDLRRLRLPFLEHSMILSSNLTVTSNNAQCDARGRVWSRTNIKADTYMIIAIVLSRAELGTGFQSNLTPPRISPSRPEQSGADHPEALLRDDL